MTGPICYVERSPDGVGLWRIRLVSERGSDMWESTGVSATDAPARAAAWIKDQLDRGSAGLTSVVADQSGGLCAWLDAPSDAPDVLSAAIRHGGSGAWGDWGGDDDVSAAELGLGTLQSIGEDGERAAVLSVPDVSIRVLIDALDAEGIAVGRVESLWHAMARAWGGARSADSDAYAATDEPEIGVLSIDRDSHGAWHAIWAWSRQGLLVAGGSARIPEGAMAGVEADAKQVGGRLSSDWLAWSAQLGHAPRRLVCLVPDDPATEPAPLLMALSSCFGDATVDAVRVEDGVEAVLTRIAERTPGGRLARDGGGDSPRGALIKLGRRPGRAHRSMYRWTTIALGVLGLALATLGWKLDSVGGEATERARALDADRRTAFAAAFPTQADHAYPADVINARLNELRQSATGPTEGVLSRPILEELDTLALILSNAGDVRLVDLSLRIELATATVTVPDTETGELLPDMLNAASRHIQWNGQFNRTTGRRGTETGLRYSLTGSWRSGSTSNGGPGV